MTDDRMDERLRDYAARWTAARPEPSSAPVLTPARTGGRWVPVAAAASVVALVAGIAYAVGPRRSPAPPVASASPAAPRPGECGAEQVRAEVTLRRDQGLSTGTLALSARSGSCTIPRAPRLAVHGGSYEGVDDLGVGYAFRGTDVPMALTAEPRRLDLVWSPGFCPQAWQTAVLRLVVTFGEGHGLGLPLDSGSVPSCEGPDGGEPNMLRAQWQQRPCDADAWAVVSGGVARRAQGVSLSVVLRNVSADVCDPYAKPGLAVRGEDGREAKLGHYVTMEARSGPGVMPGGQVRAEVWWHSYCGPALGAYTATVSVHEARFAVPLTERPVPPCNRSTLHGDIEGSSTSSWVTELPG